MQKLLLLVGLCVLVAHLEATCPRKLVCTFQSIPNLNTANLNNFNMASHMEPELCTHIVFKSVQPDNAMVIPSSGGPIQDHHNFNLAFPSATAKTLLEVDLTQTSSAIFAPLNMATFNTSVINVVDAAGFDGVNILWSQSHENEQDKIGFTALMQELNAALEEMPGTRLLTASVSGVPSDIDYSYEVPQLALVVDFFNVMTADLDRTSTPGQFAAAIAGMQKLVAKDAPKAKLNMGIATYGFDTNNANPKIWAKYQACVAPASSSTVRVDSAATIDAKAQHVVDEEFGGAFMTSLQLDDFDGVACAAGPFPVIQRVKDVVCP
ncbi:acidic mammalian chitinase-like [Hippocampus comes]|uniref:Acidic mammalian chitinase-like n=1 Tax=Hippocampus comes TaxID=109280 RepID=A0A3Q3DA44_HIPCM|nr:PREDICTED: acidic mammalian chitinase-like [Hippocampus comes]